MLMRQVIQPSQLTQLSLLKNSKVSFPVSSVPYVHCTECVLMCAIIAFGTFQVILINSAPSLMGGTRMRMSSLSLSWSPYTRTLHMISVDFPSLKRVSHSLICVDFFLTHLSLYMYISCCRIMFIMSQAQTKATLHYEPPSNQCQSFTAEEC